MQEPTRDQSVPLTSIEKPAGESHVELILRDSVLRSWMHHIRDVSPDKEPKVGGDDCIRCRVWIEVSALRRKTHALLKRWRRNLWRGKVHRFSSDLFRQARD